MNRLIAALVLTLGAVLVAGCDPDSPGTVIDKHDFPRRGKPTLYSLVIKYDTDRGKATGPEATIEVDRKMYLSCDKGDRWPACKQNIAW